MGAKIPEISAVAKSSAEGFGKGNAATTSVESYFTKMTPRLSLREAL
jgi:hypothetical protein